MQANQNQEIWRAVNGHVNYEISSHGRVRNAASGRILRQQMCKGYKQVTLGAKQNKKTYYIHKLVAEAFIDNPNNYETVDHISRNPLDNNVQNLRWASTSTQQRNKGMMKNNTSGIKGVGYEGGAKPAWYAFITDNRGNKLKTKFSPNKYPDARQRAIDWRKAKEIAYGYPPV